MAYDIMLADRVREIIAETHHITEEKKMFGGLCFMVNNKMCVGVEKDRLMLRIDPVDYENALLQEGCVEMTFTGRPMKGFVFVAREVLNTKKKLHYWLQLALSYNHLAPAPKKSKKK